MKKDENEMMMMKNNNNNKEDVLEAIDRVLERVRQTPTKWQWDRLNAVELLLMLREELKREGEEE